MAEPTVVDPPRALGRASGAVVLFVASTADHDNGIEGSDTRLMSRFHEFVDGAVICTSCCMFRNTDVWVHWSGTPLTSVSGSEGWSALMHHALPASDVPKLDPKASMTSRNF